MKSRIFDVSQVTSDRIKSADKQRKHEIKKKANELRALTANLDMESLDPWERESICQVQQIEDDCEKEERIGLVAEIMRLAGVPYGLEREHFRQKLKRKKDMTDK